MNLKLAQIIANYYDRLHHIWRHRRFGAISSNIVALALVIGTVIFLLSSFNIGGLHTKNKFLGIEMAFTILLIVEVFGLIFLLPGSFSESIGKQFEIISLILLRNAFKDFGHLPENLIWDSTGLSQMLPIAVDAFGALFLFLITGLFYKAQIHTKITDSAEEQVNFINIKKVISLFLLITFLVIGVKDTFNFFRSGSYLNSFNLFFTFLVFTDILILTYTLRFSSKYSNLFRYSSFALATVLLRMSLSAPTYYNVLISITAGLFVLTVSHVYNYLNKKDIIKSK